MGTRRSVQRTKRGYPVALLVGLNDRQAVVWIVYSESIRQHSVIDQYASPDSSEDGARYRFYNSIVSSLKSVFTTGVGSLIVASPRDANSAADVFVSHIRRHHAYLLKGIRMSSIAGDASTVNKARALTSTEAFQSLTRVVVDQESEDLVRIIDSSLYDVTGNAVVLFSLEEIDELFRNPSRTQGADSARPEYVLMTDAFWNERKSDSRLQRVMDRARNLSVKTRVLRNDSQAGARVAQLGGLVCLSVRTTK